jgi:hypothetical protein
VCAAPPGRAQTVPTSLLVESQNQDARVLRIPSRGSLVLRGDVKIEAGEYSRPAVGDDGKSGVILIEDLDGVTLDLTGVTLRGAPLGSALDESQGWGIVIRGSRDVTLRGGLIGGYKACIVAEDCHGLVLDGVGFDAWYGQRLLSSIASENQADWLRPRENDAGEWLEQYGSAISLSDCAGATVRNCRGRHGQNGILLARVTGAQVYDNDFSFMSGWGLGMFRSSENVVSRNVFDYCVRGYSHDVYWSGQDSAGILMFERCSDNLIALNSATHCGTGLFLFAGLDTVEARAFERGEQEPGGSDDNVIFQNDFSRAAASGIDATFSGGNYVIENLLGGCQQHGVWAGYSRGLVLIGNLIESTRGGGISIEHGQDAVIERNVLHENEIGLELYWDEDPHLVRGKFGQRFDTSSRGHIILGNSFSKNDSDLQIHKTTGILFSENVYDTDVRSIHASGLSDAMGKPMDKAELLERLSGIGGWMPSGHLSQASLLPPDHERLATLMESGVLDFELPEFPGLQQAYTPGADAEGLETIVMGEWGPWDFRGGDPRPRPRMPGGALADATWDVVWFGWSGGQDPRGSAENLRAWRDLAQEPLLSGQVRSWVSAWGGDPSVRERVGVNYFGLIATTRASLPAGRYRLSTISDDGVRVLLDGRAVLANWTWHAPTRDSVELDLEEGEHEFTLEYFQIDGASALSLDLEPAGP